MEVSLQDSFFLGLVLSNIANLRLMSLIRGFQSMNLLKWFRWIILKRMAANAQENAIVCSTMEIRQSMNVIASDQPKPTTPMDNVTERNDVQQVNIELEDIY